MTRIQRRPYLVPQSSRMMLGTWMLNINEREVPLGISLPGWDPATEIRMAVNVDLDLDGIYQDCQLVDETFLRLSIIWESDGTKLRGSGSRVEFLHSASNLTVPLLAVINGKCLANAVSLTVTLTTAYVGTSALTPRYPGSILLESAAHRVQLEGSGARFPTEVIDFSTTAFPNNAGWMLLWDPEDLNQALLADVRLYINSRHPQLAMAVSEARSETAGIREAIRLDVAQTIIRGALMNEEFLVHPDRFATGTIGAAARAMIRLYFEGYTLAAVHSMLSSPHQFSAYLQDKLKVFHYE